MLFSLLQSAVEQSRSALTVGDETLSFDKLLESAIRLSAGLSEIGICRGQCVAVIVPNGFEFVASVIAINAIAAIALPLNPAYEQVELTFYLGHAGVASVICANSNVAKIRDVLRELRLSVPVIALSKGTDAPHDFTTLMKSPASTPLPTLASNDIAVFLHTSGTTGRPKLVPRTVAQLSAASTILCRALNTSPGDTILCSVPLFHGQGFTNCLIAALRARASLSIPVGLVLTRDLAYVLRVIETQRITIWPSVPVVFDLLARSSYTADLSSLRLCLSGGTNLTREIFDRFIARFGVPIRQFYGCSEAGAVSANLDDDVSTSAHTVGRPFRGMEIDIEGQDDSGEGEIAIRSPTLTDGYWGLDEVNICTFANGRFCTGDLGHFDADGRLSITGRRRPFIDVAGFKVDPCEIEDVLLTYPGVREVVVVGSKVSQGRVHVLKAVIVAETTLSGDAVRRFCRGRLATFKIPNVVEFREEIPRNASGKIMRKDLL
jgi:long-chain acyl-CoA synthetase